MLRLVFWAWTNDAGEVEPEVLTGKLIRPNLVIETRIIL